jgi:hypothetical protein
MAKYRITSIPQARYGGVFNKKNTKIMKGTRRNDMSSDQEEIPMVEVSDIQQPSYWNQMQSPVMTGDQCPPGKYNFNGQCLTEAEYIAASNQEQAEAENKLNQRRNQFTSDLEKLKEENRRQSLVLYKNDLDNYFKTFDGSKKSDKIDPFKKLPLSDITKQSEEELKKQFLIHKNTETGFAELYPLNIAYDRIVNNGYQADQFKNYWGIDPKQVKEQLGPLMDAAKQQYDATVTNEIITKAVKEGKTPEEVIKTLPASLGNQTELKKFIQPVQKKLDDALNYVSNGLDVLETDNSKLAKDQDIFFSNDPQAAWEKRYHPMQTDLKYYSDKRERGQNAFNAYMDKYGVTNNPDIKYSQDDQMAMQRTANELSRNVVNFRNAENKRSSAENQDYNKALEEYLGNMTAPAQRDVLKKAIADLNDKDKLSFLNAYESDPNSAFTSLLRKKVPGSKETYQDLLQKQTFDIYNTAAIHSGHNIKQDTLNRELTTGEKVKDYLKYPFHAAYYGLNPREEMHGDWNMSYDERKKAEDKFDTDLGTMSEFTPTGVLDESFNAFNPFKIGFNLRDGYDNGEFLPALGNELWDVGSHIGMMRGLNSIGRGAGFFKPMIYNIFGNPFSQLSYYAHTPGFIEGAYDEYEKGNYMNAAEQALYAGLNIIPAVKGVKTGVKTLNSLKTPGTMMANLRPESRYSFTYNAATPGSGIFIGNPNTAIPGIGQPRFQSITKPINTLSKGLGFGEFNINKVNPGWRVPEQPMNTNLLGYDKGGLVKANLGKIVKSATKLASPAKSAIYLMESPGLKVSVPEFESLVNENLAKGLGIKKIDDQLKLKINPVMQSSFDLKGNPLLRLDMSTYVGNNLTGGIGVTRFDKGQHGIPTLEDQLIFMKEQDYPFGFSDRFNLMGTGVSGEFNKAITNSLQQVGLNPLVSSGMHTQEGQNRWNNLLEKGYATQLHKDYPFYMLHKNGGVALKLTQKEIDQYVKDGYIVEDE